MSKKTMIEIAEEIAQAVKRIEEVTGKSVRTFRIGGEPEYLVVFNEDSPKLLPELPPELQKLHRFRNKWSGTTGTFRFTRPFLCLQFPQALMAHRVPAVFATFGLLD